MKICMINYENIGLVASNFKIWWINFSKLADVTKLDLLAAPDGCVSIQRCLDRLEKGASRNLQSFSKGTHQVLPLDGVKPGFIIYSSSEEQLCREAPVDHKPETCPCSRAGQQYLRHVRQRIVSRLKGIILSLAPCWATSLSCAGSSGQGSNDMVEQALPMAMKMILTGYILPYWLHLSYKDITCYSEIFKCFLKY